MFISSAMSAVVTWGSPWRLNSSRPVSRMRSRVRRGGLRAIVGEAAISPVADPKRRACASRSAGDAQRLDLALELGECAVEVAADAAQAAPARPACVQRSRVGDRIG